MKEFEIKFNSLDDLKLFIEAATPLFEARLLIVKKRLDDLGIEYKTLGATGIVIDEALIPPYFKPKQLLKATEAIEQQIELCFEKFSVRANSGASNYDSGLLDPR